MMRRMLIALGVGALDYVLVYAVVFMLAPQMYVETAGAVLAVSAFMAAWITFVLLPRHKDLFDEQAHLKGNEMSDHLITAAYLAMGLDGHPKIGKVLDHYGQGQLELVTELVQYVPYIDALFKAGHSVAGEYPGVGEYEVTEPFGAWFGTATLATINGDTPQVSDVRQQLKTMMAEFFGQIEGADQFALCAALDAVPPIPPV